MSSTLEFQPVSQAERFLFGAWGLACNLGDAARAAMEEGLLHRTVANVKGIGDFVVNGALEVTHKGLPKAADIKDVVSLTSGEPNGQTWVRAITQGNNTLYEVGLIIRPNGGFIVKTTNRDQRVSELFNSHRLPTDRTRETSAAFVVVEGILGAAVRMRKAR